MKIYDCTTYHSEDLMIDIRLNILNEHVHKFIIVESLFSHSGNKKKLNFDINKFKKFKDKIIYLVIDKEPVDLDLSYKDNIPSNVKRLNSVKRIAQSYNYMQNGIEEASDEDLIILSDNDEIPNLNSTQLKNCKNNVIIFKQMFFYYKFNLLYDRMIWHGSKACKKKRLKSFSWLRHLKNIKYPMWRIDTLFSRNKIFDLNIIEDGGWHFTNFKTAEDLYVKLKNFGHHNEFDDSGLTIKDLKKQISDGVVNYDHFADQKTQDKYGFSYKLKKTNIDILPEYLQNNYEKYKEWFD